MGYFVAIVIVLIVAASPFVAISLVPAFLIARRAYRTIQFAVAEGFLTLGMFWTVTFLFFGVSDLIEDERLTAAGEPPWWAWLAVWDALLSAPTFAVGALVGWHAAEPREPVERATN